MCDGGTVNDVCPNRYSFDVLDALSLINCRNSKTRGGAEVKIVWKNKDLKLI